MIYDLLKNNIKKTFSDNNYEDCNYYLRELLKTTIVDTDSDLEDKNDIVWYYYFYKANIFNNIKKYNMAFKFLLRSFKFINIEYRDGLNSDYKMSLYLLAKIFENQNKNKQAIKTYEYMFKITRNKKQQMLLFYNICCLKHDNEIFTIEKKYLNCYNSNIKEDLSFSQYFAS
ncbi:beige/BEACH domain containing protein [Clostridium botulinum B str. Osaka05]|uniref:Beige/BEACH domain containing protein n=1 Tax=Clostridium botulinum B str. Osaka05 TaxID=1407017 RepID=A0A060N3C1_CLOBO|nr:hypothetical protein [Clostridium botulinum]BAO04991.1 beige/BEACH domain containing protein [Clostridium botulinum B str. Osaka05]